MFKWRRGNARRWRPHWNGRYEIEHQPTAAANLQPAPAPAPAPPESAKGAKAAAAATIKRCPSAHTYTALPFAFTLSICNINSYLLPYMYVDRQTDEMLPLVTNTLSLILMKKAKCRAYVNRTHLEPPSRVGGKLWFINRYSLGHWLCTNTLP